MNGINREALDAYVQEVLAGAPPLPQATCDAIRMLLRPESAAPRGRAA